MTRWLQAREWLLPALKAEDGGEGELLADIASGKAQLWIGERAAIVTQLISEGDGRSLHGWLAGGQLADVLNLFPGIEAWARGLGCKFASIKGRPGWARVLKPMGYAMADDELRKAL